MQELTLQQSVCLTDFAACVSRYRSFTPGIYVCVGTSVFLEGDVRLTPALVAMPNHGRLRQCDPVEHGFSGPPNFVFDVFADGDDDEFERRRALYEAAGVIEYVAVFVGSSTRCAWNRRGEEGFETISPNADVVKSLALPGLWFRTHANEDGSWSLGDSIEHGVTRLGHHEFMETIWHKDGRDPAWGDWLPFDAG